MVQLSRLYDVDTPHSSPVDFTGGSPDSALVSDESFAEAEEKRRAFWLAFAFDRFLSTRNEWPLTLHEEMVRIPTKSVLQTEEADLIGFSPDLHASPGTRDEFSEQSISPDRIFTRCHGQQWPEHAFAICGMHYFGDTLRTLHDTPAAITSCCSF